MSTAVADRPIGIFDSGLGGLTVLKSLIERLPAEHTVYLGDTARVPYGSKSPETVIRYSLQTANFLVNRGVKLLVAACNTVSATALPSLAERFDVPVVGVIEPGARAAVRHTNGGRIGVIGTRATVASRAYEEAIARIDRDIKVITAPCPLFVSLVEEGWTDNQIARLTAAEYLEPLRREKIDVLLLGCTHYPMLAGVIAEVMGDGVVLIDSSAETVNEVAGILAYRGIFRTGGGPGNREFCVTDLPAQFYEVGRRFLGAELTSASLVDL